MNKLLVISMLCASLSSTSQIIETIAGTGTSASTNLSGVPSNIDINHPWDLATDSNGNVYFTEQGSSVVRKIDAITGYISSIFGTMSPGDGPSGMQSPNYQITSPSGIFIDQGDQMYVSDFSNDKIYKVNLLDSSVSVVCGTGISGYYSDGFPATSSDIADPEGLAIGTDGLLYYAESGNSIIRRIQTDGTLSTVAGIAGVSSSLNGSTTAATFYQPFDLAIDSQNSIYVSQPLNGKIRKINQTGAIVSTYAGIGSNGFNGDSIVATSAELSEPYGLSFGANNDLFVAEYGNHIIRKISSSNSIIQTVVGTGTAGYSGDGGLGLEAELNGPIGVHVDNNGVIYLTQIEQDVVRKVKECEQAVLNGLDLVSGEFTIDCNETVSMAISGDLNDQSDWYWYKESCGGIAVGNGTTINQTLTETTTFYAQAEGECLIPSGCKEITIIVNTCDSVTIEPEVVTAFSPNNDHVNDFLIIDYAETYPTNTVIIYNRWGDGLKVFTDYDNEDVVWDGTDEFGTSVPVGTYFYIFESDNTQFTTWVNVVK